MKYSVQANGATSGYLVAIDSDVNILFLYAWDFGMYCISAIVFLDIHLDFDLGLSFNAHGAE